MFQFRSTVSLTYRRPNCNGIFPETWNKAPQQNEVAKLEIENERLKKRILGERSWCSQGVRYWQRKEFEPDYVTRAFNKIIRKSKLPAVRLHDLRHSVASNLLNSGHSPTDVSTWLGHSTPVTTFGYYAHASKASKENISNAVQGWFDTNSLDNP